jgi:hypothetical protein
MKSDRYVLLIKPGLVPLAVSFVLMGTLAPVAAQGQYVRMDGRVQWIAADTMMVLPDSGGIPVNIDLRQVPLDEYATLTQGTLVEVDGVISYDGHRLIATSVLLPRESAEQAP